MLPHAISNGVGSLNEGEHKLTLSVIITFDKKYKMIDYEILKSIIVSDKRLTYNEVNNLFYEGKFKHQEEIKTALLKLYDLSKHLIKERELTGTIDFESTELVFITDRNRKIINVEKENQKMLSV